MPIAIRRVTPEGQKNEEIAWLADDEWNLPPQIEELESWVAQNAEKLPSGEYVADVGFCWRRDAGGGGSAIDPKTLETMGRANIWLWLSEYPSFSDEKE